VTKDRKNSFISSFDENLEKSILLNFLKSYSLLIKSDSLDIVELIMALEEEFDLEIPDSEAEKITTVGDVVEYIKNNS